MTRAQSKKLKDFLRGQEYRRKQEIIKEQRQKTQHQITKDYLKTHSEIARKNENYPLTEKVLKGSPEELKLILSNETVLEINPEDYPQGLVLTEDVFR